MFTLVYVVEQGDIYGDKSREFGTDRETAEATARRWSKTDAEGVAYVVALDGAHRVGHGVFINGALDRVEGDY